MCRLRDRCGNDLLEEPNRYTQLPWRTFLWLSDSQLQQWQCVAGISPKRRIRRCPQSSGHSAYF